jgi:hypothetical protein
MLGLAANEPPVGRCSAGRLSLRFLTVRGEALTNSIMNLFPTADRLLEASAIEIERALLRRVAEITDDPMRRMIERNSVATELFGIGIGCYPDIRKRSDVDKAIARAWKALEAAGLIEEPDQDNGQRGFRVVSELGRAAIAKDDLAAAKARSMFTREMFHPSLPDAAWNAFRAGSYDTAVFEAFKAVEVAVLKKGLRKNGIVEGDHGVLLMKKAFDPNAGPLTDTGAKPPVRKARRCELFTGAMGELRNPKAHGDPTITDPLVAVEELMTAGALLRIVDNA